MIGLYHYLILSGILFIFGTLGVLLRRNALIMLMSVELMLAAANLAVIAFARFPILPPETLMLAQEDVLIASNGMAFVFIVLTVAAAEVGVGLAIIIQMFRQKKTVNIEEAHLMQG